MRYIKPILFLILTSLTSSLFSAQTIYSEGYGECWKTLQAAQEYPKKPSAKTIRKHLGCDEYEVLESGADTCGRCKWVNSYTKEKEHKCKGYVIAACKSVTSTVANNWLYQGKSDETILGEGLISTSNVNDDKLSILYSEKKKGYFLWFEYKGAQQLATKGAEFFLRTQDTNEKGRFSSDYVFKSSPVVQESSSDSTQHVIGRLTDEDITALRKYNGNDMGIGYFNTKGIWRTYLFPGKNFWPSFSRIQTAVNSDIEQTATKPSSTKVTQATTPQQTRGSITTNPSRKYDCHIEGMASCYGLQPGTGVEFKFYGGADIPGGSGGNTVRCSVLNSKEMDKAYQTYLNQEHAELVNTYCRDGIINPRSDINPYYNTHEKAKKRALDYYDNCELRSKTKCFLIENFYFNDWL